MASDQLSIVGLANHSELYPVGQQLPYPHKEVAENIETILRSHVFTTTLFSMSEGGKRVKPDAELSQDRKRLKRRRLMARMNLREAAGKSGVSLGYLSELENGYKSAGVAILGRIADAYCCEIADILPPERNGAAA